MVPRGAALAGVGGAGAGRRRRARRSTAPRSSQLSGAAVRARCDSPVFRGAVEVRTGATVHPARLAFGLRDRARGARRPGVRGVGGASRLRGDASTDDVVAAACGRGAAIVAINAATGALAPLRRRLTVASSHIVLTEPVPDVIEALGWTGGEAISDGRALLHYTRTTRDGRILFGWAGGRRPAARAPAGGWRSTPRSSRRRARTSCVLPGARRPGDRARLGRPDRRLPTHLPIVAPARRPRLGRLGYTGNGVGPSHLLGRAMAAARPRPPRRPRGDLALVEPEPASRAARSRCAWTGAARSAGADPQGGRRGGRGNAADPLTRAVAGLPRADGSAHRALAEPSRRPAGGRASVIGSGNTRPEAGGRRAFPESVPTHVRAQRRARAS